jgi:DNA repair protein RadA/Sms
VDSRVKEAAKIGFQRAILPKTNGARLKDNHGLEILGVSNVEEFLEIIFG